jgi:hypothetical protein
MEEFVMNKREIWKEQIESDENKSRSKSKKQTKPERSTNG